MEAPTDAKRTGLPGLAAPSSRLAAAAAAVLSSTWTLGALVFLVTWGGAAVAPTAGLDLSMHAGFNMGLERGFDYGRDLVFTYGPLGFLKTYLVFYAWPARLAALYGIVLQLALSLTLVWAARRSFPLPIALVLAAVAAMFARGDLSGVAVRDDAAVVVLAFVWCVAALDSRSPSWVRRLVIVGGGPFAAIEVLGKVNTGAVVLALVTVTVIALQPRRRRNLAVLAVSFAGTLAALWFASGQGLGNFGSYLVGAVQITSGYSSGARLDWETRDYDYLLAPAVVVVAAAIAWISTQGTLPRRRALILALLALLAFTSFKSGFVSHDPFHMATFYSTMLGAALAFRLPAGRAIRFGASIAIAAICAAGFTTARTGYPLTDPVENVRNGVSSMATYADPGKLSGEIARSRAAMRAAYNIDPATRKLLEGRTVHVDPSEAGAAWAYQLDWRPLPVFQPYAAWTPSLDRRNADALASADGPDRILRQRGNPLGRYPAFESPAAMIEMLCRYAPLRTTQRWQVLTRVRDRCGEPRPLGKVEAQYGAPIPVPPASQNNVIFARVHGVQVSGLERLVTLLYRARSRQVSFDGGRPYVFIAGTAADGLLLRAPPGTDFPPPFALAPNAGHVTFGLSGRASSDRITADFFEMPVSPLRSRGSRG